MNIIEQFIKEFKGNATNGEVGYLRTFADYLTANGYEIVMKECEHKNGSEWNDNDDSVCKDCGKLVLICPETPTLPEKLKLTENVQPGVINPIVITVNDLIDYLKAKK